MGEQFKIIEYPLILLFIITGGLFLMSSCDVISIFLSIELQSYGLYLLATLYKNSELSTSAGLTYFLLGGLSSSFILLGSSLLYANSGTTNLDGYYIMTGISNLADYSKNSSLILYNMSYIDTSFLIMGVGFLFKISAAPFHFWSPDVYDAIPTIVTTFVAIIAKISILILLLELVHYTSNLFFKYDFNWTDSLLLSCLLSFVIGTVLGLSQPRIKKLFAYSTISHVGFILLAISVNTLESIEAFIFYLLQYSLSNLNAFIILICIGFTLYPLVYEGKPISEDKKFKSNSSDAEPRAEQDKYKNLSTSQLQERNYSPIQLISELKGYFQINPLLALSFAITLFSFIGIPPLMGFFAKQMVLSSALNNGYIFLCIIAILTSVISASYYLSIIKEIFFEKCDLVINNKFLGKTYNYLILSYFSKNHVQSYNNNYNIDNLTLSSFLTLTISILTLLLLLFMFASQEWLRMTRLLSLLLIDT